jgi:hypothetical protein
MGNIITACWGGFRNPYIVGKFGAHTKFQNPRTAFSGRKVTGLEDLKWPLHSACNAKGQCTHFDPTNNIRNQKCFDDLMMTRTQRGGIPKIAFCTFHLFPASLTPPPEGLEIFLYYNYQEIISLAFIYFCGTFGKLNFML